MSITGPGQAWLESPDGGRLPLVGNLSFGRTLGNEVVIPDDRVSRRHAILHAQGDSGYWLVDLGSRNGTYLNDRRVSLPVRLRDRDAIRIGPRCFVFHDGEGGADLQTTHATIPTLMDVRVVPCWLLVADILGSTLRAQAAAPGEMAAEMSQWFLRCRQSVEAADGTLNKYLGDGFLAFWRPPQSTPEQVHRILSQLREMQSTGRPDFRYVLHHGDVHLGGAASMGEDSLSGPAVNFVFRMEKLAGSLGVPALVSEPAADLLRERLPLGDAGEHSLAGFTGRFRLFRPWPPESGAATS